MPRSHSRVQLTQGWILGWWVFRLLQLITCALSPVVSGDADPEGNHWQGKQLGKPSLNLAIRGRAGPGIGQQYPHGSPPPLPELQQSIFPQYPSPGIRLHSSDPAQGSNPCRPVSHHVVPSMGCHTICRVSTAPFCPYNIPGRQTIILPISQVRTLRSQAACY